MPASPDAPASDTLRVLVIDDSPLIRRLVQLALQAEPGWQVTVAESGERGAEVAAQEKPDAILLDVEMPGLSGPATLERLRRQEATRDVPVLFLTAHSGEAEAAELRAAGAAGVIAKPFDAATLSGEVAAALGW